MQFVRGVVLVVFAGACQPSWPSGISVAGPVQEELTQQTPRSFLFRGHVVQPRALYRIEALVLSRAAYRFDDNADVSPLDLALGWGPMSDAALLQQLRVRQNDRYFFWSASSLPLARDEIERHAANTHLAWGSRAVDDVLDDVDVGDIVTLRGALVDVTFADGHEMKTSLSRTDVGGGACEVMWVDEASVRAP